MQIELLNQGIEILSFPDNPERMIELAGRNCYKSEARITKDSHKKFVKMLKARGHNAMLEFGGFPIVRITTNRGVTHEIVRHRLFSFAQESTRYVDYYDTFRVIIPHYLEEEINPGDSISEIESKSPHAIAWYESIQAARDSYQRLRTIGLKPEDARGVLPNDLAADIVVGGNTREWLHFFKLRASKYAHPQMRQIAMMIKDEFTRRAPILFEE